MKKTITTGTQKNLVNYISGKYGLTKKSINELIKTARANKYIWDEIIVNDTIITIYVVVGKMFVGERKAT